MKQYTGRPASSGIAIGAFTEWSSGQQSVEKKQTQNVDRELTRYEAARDEAIAELGELHTKAIQEVGEEKAAVFEVHQMLLMDAAFNDSVQTLIREQSVNTEYAVDQTGQQLAAMFEAMDDEYMKARSADMRDIAGRVVRILQGGTECSGTLEEPCIIVADDLSPSETIRLDKSKVLAFVTRQGSMQSHTAILARTMGIPAVVGVPIPKYASNQFGTCIVDGNQGNVYIEAAEDARTDGKEWQNLLNQYQEKQVADQKQKQLLQQLKGRPVYRKDGSQMKLCANIGGVSDIDAALLNDADGVGLFRSEFLYLKSADYPTEEEQFAAYKEAAEKMDGRQVIIRTLDIGADKQIDYFNLEHEDNPALGYRAIRICLTREEIFRTQLRALYRASAFGNIAIMFPMITALWEVKRIKEIAAEVRKELTIGYTAATNQTKEETAFRNTETYRRTLEKVPLGIMVETPAAVMLSEELAKEVDFFSIGTNDLTQYTLAVDRQNRNLERFYDAHHPAVLQMIRMTVENSHKAGIWTGICGELAADVSLVQTFMEMGVDELSMSPSSILKVKHKLLCK